MGFRRNTIKHSKECKILLDNFAAACAAYMNCTLQNARPVQICISCVEEYNKVLNQFDKIIKVSILFFYVIILTFTNLVNLNG